MKKIAIIVVTALALISLFARASSDATEPGVETAKQATLSRAAQIEEATK